MRNHKYTQHVLPLAGCVAIAMALLLWGRARGFVHQSWLGSTAVLLLVSTCLAFALPAFRRHLRVAATARGSYAARHSGLVWGLGVWSAMTYMSVRRDTGMDKGFEEILWQLLFTGAVGLPTCLWAGLFWRGTMARLLGSDRNSAA